MGLNNYGLQIIVTIVIKQGAQKKLLNSFDEHGKDFHYMINNLKKQIIALGIHSINLCSPREKHYLGHF